MNAGSPPGCLGALRGAGWVPAAHRGAAFTGSVSWGRDTRNRATGGAGPGPEDWGRDACVTCSAVTRAPLHTRPEGSDDCVLQVLPHSHPALRTPGLGSADL